MSERLRRSLQEKFKGAPNTAKNAALFEELLGNLTDRARELSSLGMSEEQAIETALHEMGDIGPLLTEEPEKEPDPHARPIETRHVEGRERQLYPPEALRRRKIRQGLGIAVSVALFILSVVPALFGDLLALLIFPIVGLGVSAIIWTNITYGGYLDNSALSYSAARMARDSGRANCFLTLGILLCILAVVPAAAIPTEIGVMLMFLSVALGVGMIIFSSFLRPTVDKAAVPRTPAYASVIEEEEKKPRRSYTWLVVLLCLLVVIGGFIALLIVNDYEFAIYFSDTSLMGLEHKGSGTVSDPVSRVCVDWRHGKVEVKPAPEGDTVLSIVATGAGGTPLPEDDDVCWGVQNGRLLIADDNSKLFRVYFGKRREKNLVIYLPNGGENITNLDIGVSSADVFVSDITISEKAEISSASGNVEISMLEMPHRDANQFLRISTASGNVTLRDVKASELRLSTASGDVDVQNSACVNFDASTSSGSLRFLGTAEYIKAETASGHVMLGLGGVFHRAEISTASGDVTLEILENTCGFTLEYDTASGNISTDGVSLEWANGRVSYRNDAYPDQKGIVEVDTASGALTLKKTQ